MDSQIDGSQTKNIPQQHLLLGQHLQKEFNQNSRLSSKQLKNSELSLAHLRLYYKPTRGKEELVRKRLGLDAEEKFQQQQSNPKDHLSPQQPLPINQTQMTLPQEQAQQFQIFQLGLQMNPYIPLQQNLYLEQNPFQIPNPQLMYYYWQLNNLRQQALSQQYGKILDPRLFITPIQSSKWLDAKFNEIGTTLKDFN